LSDSQLAAVTAAANDLSAEKRATFLQRVSARLRLHGGRPSDAQLDKAIQAALRGLVLATVRP
jgi:hypothetical protein